MTAAEKREAARQFCQRWSGKGHEDQDDRSYWLDILQRIMGAEDATGRVEFQKRVIVDGNVKKIDAYIPETKVIIEQKSLNIPLDKKVHQSGGADLTPYEQAKRYNDNLPTHEKARWIVTSNFAEIWVYDMDTQEPEKNITKIALADIQNHYPMLDFLLSKEVKKITEEMELSLKAGELVGKIYDKFLEQYNDPSSKETQDSLNILCVRLVFCLYAEDAGLFGVKDSFRKYIAQYEAKDIRRALIDLFEVLNTPYDKRAALYLNNQLAAFPYVNGGLFEKGDTEIPLVTNEIKAVLLKASFFDWSRISPTIFGAVFESTLNPETRRSGGMHYTSIENIHKVIDPLFLDDLKTELAEIKDIPIAKTKEKRLKEFQDKLSSLKFLDPACGSGNFLTETYVSLRRLENEVLRTLKSEATESGAEADESAPIKVRISNFYGIEINDFAVTVAKTALWIAESQMVRETEDIVRQDIDFLPLKTSAAIVCANALRIDWNDVVDKNVLSYIMGNPPFVGYGLQTEEQKKDVLSIYVDASGNTYRSAGKIDYVACWYYKASKLIQNTKTNVAFVSTNSITQGEQVSTVWKPLFDQFHIHIDFAYKSFIWDSEANAKAHVHCVIVGFSACPSGKTKRIFSSDNIAKASNINAYLIDADNVFIDKRSQPLCDVLPMTTGNRPADGGHLIIEAKDYDDFISNEPKAIKYIKCLTGAEEYINNKKRYCLWLVGVSPSELKQMPAVYKRIEACREARLHGAPDRQKLADTPALFREIQNPKSYIVVPRVSSENRRYIPLGFLDDNVIPTDSATIIVNAGLYEFGVLESNVHMAWMRAVCGRLKSDYRYSKDIVYNNFPWPTPTDKQKAAIEKTAQAILDARALYPECSLADLYDPLTMPKKLREAHQANDSAVMRAYGLSVKDTSEADCVAFLMKMYMKLTEKS